MRKLFYRHLLNDDTGAHATMRALGESICSAGGSYVFIGDDEMRLTADNLLRCKYLAAFGAMRSCGQSLFGAGGFFLGIGHLGVRELFDRYRFFNATAFANSAYLAVSRAGRADHGFKIRPGMLALGNYCS